MALTFVETITLQKNDMVMTYRGKNGMGGNFFAYIRCQKEGYVKMHEDYKVSTPRHLIEYGEILYQDNLENPDEKAKQFLADYLKQNS